MLVVATEADNTRGFVEAVKMAVELLRRVEVRYFSHCSWAGVYPVNPTFTIANMQQSVWRELQAALGDELPPRHHTGATP